MLIQDFAQKQTSHFPHQVSLHPHFSFLSTTITTSMTHHGKSYFRQVEWDISKDRPELEQHYYGEESDITLDPSPKLYFDPVSSAALENLKNSFSVSPKTTKVRIESWLNEIPLDQTERYYQPVVSQTNVHASIEELFSPGRNPITPEPLETDPFLYLETPSTYQILNRQHKIFKKLERICTQAAAKHWNISKPVSIDQRENAKHTLGNHSQRYHPYHSDRPRECKHARQSGITEPTMTLKDCIAKISNLHFGRAHALKDNDDTVFGETLMRTTKLFDWADQVEQVAAEGAKGMDDTEIEDAITGARDMVVWLMDGKGEMRIKKLFQGTRVYGGLVLKEGE